MINFRDNVVWISAGIFPVALNGQINRHHKALIFLLSRPLSSLVHYHLWLQALCAVAQSTICAIPPRVFHKGSRMDLLLPGKTLQAALLFVGHLACYRYLFP